MSVDVDMKVKTACFYLSLRSFMSCLSPLLSNVKKKLNYIFQNLENKAKGKTSKLKWSDRREKKANSV